MKKFFTMMLSLMLVMSMASAVLADTIEAEGTYGDGDDNTEILVYGTYIPYTEDPFIQVDLSWDGLTFNYVVDAEGNGNWEIPANDDSSISTRQVAVESTSNQCLKVEMAFTKNEEITDDIGVNFTEPANSDGLEYYVPEEGNCGRFYLYYGNTSEGVRVGMFDVMPTGKLSSGYVSETALGNIIVTITPATTSDIWPEENNG